jgi:NitT/TauT family transport system substrate-binding protein
MPSFRLGRGRPAFVLAAVTVLAGVLAGCGAQTADDLAGGQPEMSRVAVGALPIVDSAALYIAMKKGYFADEGLRVDVKTLASGAAAVPGLAAGELQFAMGNYVSFFAAQAAGTLDIKLVADAYQAQPGTLLIMVGRNSPIQRPLNLAGKKIAVNTRNNVVELTARSALQSAGVDVKTVTFVPIPFPDMAEALTKRTVDAAYMVEPYATLAQKDSGAVAVVDAATGPTAQIPIAGWVTSAKFVSDMPKTVRAFQRAIIKGQAAAADRIEVEQVLAEYLKVDATTLSLMNLGTWPTTLEATRIQRIIDLMSAANQLSAPVDPKKMIIKPPSG